MLKTDDQDYIYNFTSAYGIQASQQHLLTIFKFVTSDTSKSATNCLLTTREFVALKGKSTRLSKSHNVELLGMEANELETHTEFCPTKTTHYFSRDNY